MYHKSGSAISWTIPVKRMREPGVVVGVRSGRLAVGGRSFVRAPRLGIGRDEPPVTAWKAVRMRAWMVPRGSVAHVGGDGGGTSSIANRVMRGEGKEENKKRERARGEEMQ